MTDPIGSRSPVMALQRIERPVGIGDHADPALGPEENGEMRGRVSGLRRGLGSVHQLRGVFNKAAHNSHFGNRRADLREMLSALAKATVDGQDLPCYEVTSL